MQFFVEYTALDDSLLERIGMENHRNRSFLTEYVGSMFRHVCPDLKAVYMEFIGCLNRKVTELDSCQSKCIEFQRRIDMMEADIRTHLSELDDRQSRLLILDTRASELSIVNGQLKEAIAAYKENRTRYKRNMAESDSTIASLRIDMKEYDSRLAKCLADACTADSINNAQMMRLKSTNTRLRQVVAHRGNVLKRHIANFRLGTFKTEWETKQWSRRSRKMQKRCGCKASIIYFQKSNIDLEWVRFQARCASDRFERDIKQTTDDMRMQMQMVCIERDDALADCALYIDRMLQADEKLQISNLSYAAILSELSVAKMDIAKRQGVERGMFRSQLFRGLDGMDMMCPVLTMDGVLIPLIDVYRGWMSSNHDGDGADRKFICPVTGMFRARFCQYCFVII